MTLHINKPFERYTRTSVPLVLLQGSCTLSNKSSQNEVSLSNLGLPSSAIWASSPSFKTTVQLGEVRLTCKNLRFLWPWIFTSQQTPAYYYLLFLLQVHPKTTNQAEDSIVQGNMKTSSNPQRVFKVRN